MQAGRRTFLSAIAGTLAGTTVVLAGSQGQRRDSSRLPQIPDASGTGAADDVPLPPRVNPKTLLKEEQKELRHDVDRLLQMVKALKDESDNTPEADVLSVSLVKKAGDIEKLARQIKELIRAS